MSKISNEWLGASGHKYRFDFYDSENFDNLDYNKCAQCYAVCYVNDKVLIVKNGKKNTWGMIGGTIEHELGEGFEDTLRRELVEEGNVNMTYCKPIGYQEVHNITTGEFESYQLRYYVEANVFGEFISDPAGSISEVAFIDVDDINKYFNWGAVGAHIIERAKEIHSLRH